MPADATITLAVTGASGFPYALRLLEVLLAARCRVYLMVSRAARVVAATESSLRLKAQPARLARQLQDLLGAGEGQLSVFGEEDWFAPVASGSGAPSRMVVCPCSTGTLSAIACGASNNLIERAADVVLKERRQLILVPRESPYSTIHLEHMLSLSRQGVVILPASPGFYHRPAAIADLVDFVVARILNHLQVEHRLMPPWGRTGSTPVAGMEESGEGA